MQSASVTANTRVLTLNEDSVSEKVLYRLKKGCTVRFLLGYELKKQTGRVRLFCNYPVSGNGNTFNRSYYNELQWLDGHNKEKYCELTFQLSGSFQFYYQLGDEKSIRREGFFVVDPVVSIGNNVVPLEAICMQTVLPKCLGPLSEWEGRLMVLKQCGYNAIHFTPLQHLGGSLSSYSLRDQLTPNPIFSSKEKTVTFDDLNEFFEKLENEWGMMTITDVVWNHTSYCTPWLKEHPDATYNLVNSPHLRPAFLIDRALYHLTLEIARGKWQFWGLTGEIKSERDLDIIATVLRQCILPEINLSDFYCVDVERVIAEFKRECQNCPCPDIYLDNTAKEVEVIQDPEYKRFNCTVDMQKVLLDFNVRRMDAVNEEERISCNCEWLRKALEDSNRRAKERADDILENVVQSVYGTVRYERLDETGPKHTEISDECPLMTRYFHYPHETKSLKKEENVMNDPQLACHIAALNGWVFSDDPLKNFAESDSEVYLRRRLICWGDSCKLRYGKRPADSPFLWEYMRKYSELMAKLCHGLRIDNCHSTPIHVARHFIDAARKVRPELFVVAELFTNSEEVDNIFVNNLGITCLIREMMTAPDSHEEGRLVYKYGGDPVGSFLKSLDAPLRPSVTPAILAAITHDNPCLIKIRSVWDCLPTIAMTAMAGCSLASSRGYEELAPFQISVVSEDRLYTSWTDNTIEFTDKRGLVGESQGIIKAVRSVNGLHGTMGYGNFSEVFVDQMDPDTVAVTRFSPEMNQSIILVARSCFKEPKVEELPTMYNPAQGTGFRKPLIIEGELLEVILEARLLVRENPADYVTSQEYITGWWQSHVLDCRENIKWQESKMISVDQNNSHSEQVVNFVSFPPGCVIAFRVQVRSSSHNAIITIRKCLNGLRNRDQDVSVDNLSFFSAIEKLNLADLNYVIYRCNSEEKDEDFRSGAYVVPDYGELVYCGLQGFITVLDKIRWNNDLGHAFCNNLRDGSWIMDYISNRLKARQATRELGHWLELIFKRMKLIPRFLRPKFFDALIKTIHEILLDKCWSKMSSFIREGRLFVQMLALNSVQLVGHCKSAPLSPVIENPELSGQKLQFRISASMSAGLPHFSTGAMRCWGRDTFIALRGLLLITNRHEEAKDAILAFGGCLRHGLIPNLLGGGVNARYNCRDATWWWLQCIQDYCNFVPNGYAILKHPVVRIYPTDGAEPQLTGEVVQPLYDIMQEALQRHIDGVTFRERGAGPMLDRHMKEKGFDVSIGVNRTTGFVYGGNAYNCGTWMDKMGESVVAGNCGIPATPRDGSAIELVGLCKSTVKWLAKSHKDGLYPYGGVRDVLKSKKKMFTYEEWNFLLLQTFERYFWIEEEGNPTDSPLIHRRGIYKDCLGATHQYTDFQLRPNQCVAMVVAPDMFQPEHAWVALKHVEEILSGPLGMKTLDPKDWNYNGYYVNSLESYDHKSAKGFNYHQGPEWLWCTGFFLRAKLTFAKAVGRLEEAIDLVNRRLAEYESALARSDWKGLPELTNRDGEHCSDSCPVQAWSAACILEVLYDLDQLS